MKVVVTIVGTLAYFLIYFIIKFVVWDMFPDWAAQKDLIKLEIMMTSVSTGIVWWLIYGLLGQDENRWNLMSICGMAFIVAVINYVLIAILPASITLGIIINIVNIAAIATATHFSEE